MHIHGVTTSGTAIEFFISLVASRFNAMTIGKSKKGDDTALELEIRRDGF
jgi:hypothetical protein